MRVNLGTNSVTMYDEYGNAETLTSENGIYNLTLTQSTVYIKGFNNFAPSDTGNGTAKSEIPVFMTGRIYADDFTFSSGTAVAYKYTKGNSPDLASLWSTKEKGEKVWVNLGTNSVKTYDIYGNAKTLTSENGIYNLTLTQSTLYIEGSFNAFEEAN